MPKVNPSQYDCNNMKPGDSIYVSRKPLWYRIVRHLFLKDKVKLNIKEYITDECKTYKTHYQEDCILIYDYEKKCTFSYENSIPVTLINSKGKIIRDKQTLDNMIVSLDTIAFKISKDLTIRIPSVNIKSAIEKVQQTFKQIDNSRLVEEQIRYLKYKGKDFKQIYIDKGITSWNVSYCSVCGNPIEYKFNDDGVIIKNKCNCGNTVLNLKFLTWNEFAVWYASQTTPSVKKLYQKFWFGEGK